MEAIIGFGALLVLIIAVVAFVLSRMRVVDQTTAMLISGSGGANGTKVVRPGGRAFIIPVIQSARLVPLSQMTVQLAVEGVDNNKIPIEVTGVAMVKVTQDEQAIRDAAERFGSAEKSFEEEIVRKLQLALTGSLRSAIAGLTVDSLLVNREELAQKVRSSTESEVKVMGLSIDSFQVLEVRDKNGHIAALGARESEKVKADARTAKAENDQRANQAEVTSRTSIAEQNRDLAIRQAQLQSEQDKAQAIASAAGPLAKAEQDRAIAELEQQTASERAVLRERELDTEVRKPADATRYAAEQAAEAEKNSAVFRAQAEAEKVNLAALSESESVRIRGMAEAESIAAIGAAEAEAMQKKADAYKNYGEAAVTELILAKAPEIARALAEPMGNIDNMTIISTDGASALPKAVANNMGQLDSIMKNLLGTGVNDLLSKLGSDTTTPTTPEIGVSKQV